MPIADPNPDRITDGIRPSGPCLFTLQSNERISSKARKEVFCLRYVFNFKPSPGSCVLRPVSLVSLDSLCALRFSAYRYTARLALLALLYTHYDEQEQE